MSVHEEWYFDLQRGIAVPASERGHADHMLGPYPTKGEAENWKATVDTRNEVWDEADEEWDGEPREATTTPPVADD